MSILRYLGINKEAVFGTKVAPKFFVDQASSDVNPPDGAELLKPGGLTRVKRNHSPGPYVPGGTVPFVVDPPLLYYFLWLLLGTKTTVDNTTLVSDEATPSDASGDISATLAKLPVIPGSVMVETSAPLQEYHDNGFGLMLATTLVADEAHPTGAGETTLALTLEEEDIAPSTFEFYNAVPTLVAVDDGFGTIVESEGSGVSGTIDYASGDVTLADLTASIAYTADYAHFAAPTTIDGTINYTTGVMSISGATVSHAYTTTYYEGDTAGTFEHTIIGDLTQQEMLSSTLKLGKDEFMHTFKGTAITQIVIAVEREWALATLTVVSQKDEKETVLPLASVKVPQGYPLPFHKMTIKEADYDSALTDYSAQVEGLTLTINANSDGEGGVTLGSRYPRRVWSGELMITADLTLVFDSTSELEDFWGGAAGPSDDGTTEKAYQITMDGGVLGNIVIDLYKCIMTSPPTISPSGRDRVSQSLSVEAIYDDATLKIINAVCDSVYNYA